MIHTPSLIPATNDRAKKETEDAKEEEEDMATDFTLILSGQVESAKVYYFSLSIHLFLSFARFITESHTQRVYQFHSIDNAYCKYSFSYGPDWRPIQGVEQGISQISRKAGGSNQLIVWNFPIDIAFQSTNAHGWPRLVVSVYNLDFMGRDVVRGYACVLVPPFPGRYVRYAKMFVPCSTSMMQGFLAWLSGNRPEFYHAKFISQGKDREVTKVSSSGVVKVVLNVTAMGLKKCGYSSS